MAQYIRASSLISISVTILCVLAIGVPSVDKEPLVEPIAAAAVPGSQPQACFGFTQINGRLAQSNRECPANHALFSIDDDSGKRRAGRTINVSSTCCPLPSNDILSDSHIFAAEECPEEYIATGANKVACDEDYCPVLMRCTKINTELYLLAETTQSKYWGNGHAGWRDSQRIDREEIPLGIRYAVGRSASKNYGADGCVGYPWGSLLTKKSGKYCHSYGFRQLQFKGAANDPQAGTPVKMFADCNEVHNPHDPAQAHCTTKATVRS